jgi:hypothetical protein
MIAVLAAPSYAQPTPFVINGRIFYENGTACNNPAVNMTNLNTIAEWQAETNASYNYYQIMLANGTDLNVSEILRFNVTSPDGSQSNTTEHTVTQDEVNNGGIFGFNITLASSANIVINEFVANPSSGNDWVELYNPAGSDISLDGWTLNDSTSQMESLSGTINASGYRVFEVSDRLNTGSDTITLLNSTTVVDEVTYGAAAGNAPVPITNESAGRYPNGEDTDVDSDDFTIFDTPTSGAENVLGDVSVEMDDYDILPSPSGNLTAPIMLQNITGYGTATITLEYNESVVHVTTVADGQFSAVQACNINNTTGTVRISAWNMTEVDGDIEFALITFEAVGGDGDTTPLTLSVQTLQDIDYNNLANHASNGSITLIAAPPVISNENATPGKIIQTNLSGRDRNVSRNTTTLSVNVTATGGSGVKNVTINLTPIGGSANTPMTNGGSGDIYSVDTTATDGINLTHNLVVTARDNNDNTATSNITLEVLRRGDVVRNNKVDIGDALYIARYTVGLEPPADNWLLVGDIVGEGGNELGDNSVDMSDALYIARYTVGLEEEP